MGGARETLEAPTKDELKTKALAWQRGAKGLGLSDIRWGWDEDRVVKTETGYSIELYAHS